MSMSEKVCHHCDGTGIDPYNYSEDCIYCDGEGIVVNERKNEVYRYRDSGYSHEMQKKSTKNQHRVNAKLKQSKKYGHST